MRAVEFLGHTFIPALIEPRGVVLDCGSNNGDFARWLAENTRTRVYAFEPDPRLYKKLPVLEGVRFFPYAVGSDEGIVVLNLGNARCSSMEYAEQPDQQRVNVPSVQLERFCRDHGIGVIDLIKMDIEGAEVPVLLTASDQFLRGVKQITVEFHDFLRSEDVPLILRIVDKMRGLGFEVVKFSHHTFGDVLLLNTKLIDLGLLDRLSLRIVKYRRGLARMLTRRLRRTSTG